LCLSTHFFEDFFEDFFDERFFEDFFEDFFLGTFAPSFLASERPIAIACYLLVTFFPERPLLSVPSFRSCIAFSTFLPAFFPYLAIELIAPCVMVKWQICSESYSSSVPDKD